ncbi:MAG: hypothetical protein AAGG51_21060 [Cyanobacteria bacterium P01_G01_bin.54]
MSTYPELTFISYKRDVSPDEAIALALHQALSQRHRVFIDQRMPVGTQWLKLHLNFEP